MCLYLLLGARSPQMSPYSSAKTSCSVPDISYDSTINYLFLMCCKFGTGCVGIEKKWFQTDYTRPTVLIGHI